MKAIALISGGLDSILAARLIRNQGIEVIGLHFKTPFAPRLQDTQRSLKRQLGADIEIKKVNLGDDYLKIVKGPRYGYGSNLNPCIDCKIFMLRKAKQLMQELGAKFIITGEVLGQRPMSQLRQALMLIEKRSGLQGLLIRPLSAKLLVETLPEKEGWVKRQDLLDVNGRSRRIQIELAERLGIKDYPNPAGGCLLTDPGFTQKAKDLISYGELNLENIELLKLGRHFRFSAKAKLVVGRDEKENECLARLAKRGDYLFMPPLEIAGPTALGRGFFTGELIRLSCSVTCRYCDLNGRNSAGISYKKIGRKEEKTIEVRAIEEPQLIKFRI